MIVKYLSPRYSSILGTWSPLPRDHFRPEPSPGFLPIAERKVASVDASNVKNTLRRYPRAISQSTEPNRSTTSPAQSARVPSGARQVSRSIPPIARPSSRTPSSRPIPPPAPLTRRGTAASASARVAHVVGLSALALSSVRGEYGTLVTLPLRCSLRHVTQRTRSFSADRGSPSLGPPSPMCSRSAKADYPTRPRGHGEQLRWLHQRASVVHHTTFTGARHASSAARSSDRRHRGHRGDT